MRQTVSEDDHVPGRPLVCVLETVLGHWDRTGSKAYCQERLDEHDLKNNVHFQEKRHIPVVVTKSTFIERTDLCLRNFNNSSAQDDLHIHL